MPKQKLTKNDIVALMVIARNALYHVEGLSDVSYRNLDLEGLDRGEIMEIFYNFSATGVYDTEDPLSLCEELLDNLDD